MSPQSIAEAQRHWRPETVYLNTASYGLPPEPGWTALQEALADWRGGRTSWEHWGAAATRSREAFAELVAVEPARVSIGATVSEFIGLIASALPDGSRVVAPEEDFTSLLFPFLAQEARGVELTTVPLAQLDEAVEPSTDVVAFSAVQSATGELADLDALAAAARAHGAWTVVDATQACGWLPLRAGDFDAVACAAYKWLMSPRGSAFLSMGEELAEIVVPHSAGWWAGEDPHASYYGPPLRLARDARRFDTSPAWFSWVGTAPALELIADIGVAAIREHDVALANRFLAGLGLPPGRSAIVNVDAPGAEHRLAGAGVMAATRAGHLRASFHVYNDEADVDTALAALRGEPD